MIAVASRGFGGDLVLLTIAVITVVVSWTMVAFAFSVAYLRENAAAGGLDFPGEDKGPGLVGLPLSVGPGVDHLRRLRRRHHPERRVVTMHSLLAFVLNTGILAIFVSILIGS